MSCKSPTHNNNCASQRNALWCIIGGIVEERAGLREPRAKFYRAYWRDGRTGRRARRDRAEWATTEHVFEGCRTEQQRGPTTEHIVGMVGQARELGGMVGQSREGQLGSSRAPMVTGCWKAEVAASRSYMPMPLHNYPPYACCSC